MISLHFLITAFVVVLAPGTGVIYTLAVGLGQGRGAAIAAAAGCTAGIVPHLAAAMLGLAAVLHASALLFTLVKLLGVAYLLWLAWQAVSAGGALHIGQGGAARHESGWQIARRGALVNILNPKLSIFFLALLPPFLTGRAETAAAEIVLLGGVFMAMTLAVFVLYGIFAAEARVLLTARPGVVRWMNRGFAAAFAALAGRLALERA